MTMLDIYIKADSKDNFTDFLLKNGYDDFFYIDTKKYAAKHMLQGDEEQVSGRQSYAMFKIYLEHDVAINLARNLKKQFSNIKIYALQCEAQ